MIRDEPLLREGAALSEAGTLPSPRSTQGDETVDSASDLDIEESLRLLDEIWPRDDCHEARIPRQFGRFSILGELGRGGFGVVYLAEDPLLDRRVALKVPRVEVLSGTDGWRRFLREARAASRLDHPNLIPLLEAGAIGPVGYIVSAYVAGPSLERWLRHKGRRTSPRWAAQLVATLAHAIEHAHQRGILHRDLKPANVLLHIPECECEPPSRQAWEGGRAESWMPRICDFGLARLREIEADESRSRFAAGSPPYMAPEQAETRNSDIGPATDVYGLGAILYEILTGRPPFSGKSDLETLRRVVGDEPVPPRQLRPGLPRDLETICLKCLAKRPDQRYSSAAVLAEDLERSLDGRPILARPVPVWERGWRWTCRNPAQVALAAAVVLAVVAGLGGLLWHESALRRVNDQLRLAAKRAEDNAQDALDQRSLVEERERLVKRQLAGHQISSAQQAVAARNFERALWLLDAAEPELGRPADRGFAWSFLRRFVRDRLEVLPAQAGPVSCLTVSDDGRTLASGNEHGEIWLWDSRSGNSRRLAPVQSDRIRRVVLSPDGRALAAAVLNSAEIAVWDVPSGQLRGRLALGGAEVVSSLLFTTDGQRLAVVRRHPAQAGLPFSCWGLTPSTGEFLMVAPENVGATAVELADPRLQELADLMDDARPSLSASHDELYRSWVERAPRGIARTRDQALALVGFGDGSFAVHGVRSGRRLMVARLHPQGTVIVFFDAQKPEERLSPPVRDRLERLSGFLVPTPSARRRESDIIVHQTFSEPVAFSPDGTRLAIWREEEDRLRILDLTTGRECSTFDLGPLNNLSTVAFTPDGETVAFGAADGKVRLWHLNAPRNPEILRGHAPKEAWSVAFAPDGRTLASAGDDHCIRLWDIATGREKATLRGHHALVTSLAFAPDGRTLASGSFDLRTPTPIIVWDIATLSQRFVLRGHTRWVRAVAFSPDSRTLASDADEDSVMIWDTKEGRRTATIPQAPGNINCLAFSPNGLTLASGAGLDGLALTDTDSGLRRLITTDTRPSALTFSPDGSHLITGHENGLIKTWDVALGRQVQTLSGHANMVLSLAVSPDGRTLASAGEDRTVRVWDAATGQELLCLTDCKARVNAVAFSPDGCILAAADHMGAVTLWRARPTH